jgi:hypothetical protein
MHEMESFARNIGVRVYQDSNGDTMLAYAVQKYVYIQNLESYSWTKFDRGWVLFYMVGMTYRCSVGTCAYTGSSFVVN